MQPALSNTADLEDALDVLDRLPEEARIAFDQMRASFDREFQPQTPLEERLVALYALALFQHERSLVVETLFMERFLEDPDNADAERRWSRFMRIANTKGRAAAKAMRDLQTAIANRIISSQLAAENNQSIPNATPFVQLHTKAALAKFITPRSLANSVAIPRSLRE